MLATFTNEWCFGSIMKILTLALGLALLMPTLAVADDERPLLLPFDVTLGGQKAVIKGKLDLFAMIENPVKPDAALVIEEISPLLIVNAFPCKEDGTVLENQPAAVIFAQNTAEVKLSDTMDKTQLAPGSYLANIVAHNKTSRIVFHVGEPDAMVDFSKIRMFLEKMAGGE